MDLIDHCYYDHIFFPGCCSPNFMVLIYLVKKVLEVGAWRGLPQVSLINMWESCYCVASESLEPEGALRYEN